MKQDLEARLERALAPRKTRKARKFIARTATSQLAAGDLVLVRFGAGGTQIAKIVSVDGKGGMVARKWKSNSGGWTKPRPIREWNLRGAPTADDPRRKEIAKWDEQLLTLLGDAAGGALPTEAEVAQHNDEET